MNAFIESEEREKIRINDNTLEYTNIKEYIESE